MSVIWTEDQQLSESFSSVLTVRLIQISISLQFSYSCSVQTHTMLMAAVEGRVGIFWQLLIRIVSLSQNFVQLALNTAASPDNSVPGTLPRQCAWHCARMLSHLALVARTQKWNYLQYGLRIPPQNVSLTTLSSWVNGASNWLLCHFAVELTEHCLQLWKEHLQKKKKKVKSTQFSAVHETWTEWTISNVL